MIAINCTLEVFMMVVTEAALRRCSYEKVF